MEREPLYDLVVIGGGINGVGIAADAQGRGLSVLLCEQHDLANATSSKSSKLIHGGLRYLQQYDFSLVRESLRERKILSTLAPHLVRPLRFVIPFKTSKQPFWFVRMGLYLYDWMGAGKAFKRSKIVHFDQDDPYNPLLPDCRKGFIYSDAQTDDARLVIANALRFAEKGGKILTRTQVVAAERHTNDWQIQLRCLTTQTEFVVHAKALVNAAGPWIDTVLANVVKVPSNFRSRLVKGSHIVVKKLYNRDEAYLLPHPDGRIVFVIPYLDEFTLIGTTDVAFDGDPLAVTISDEEIHYLCDIVQQYLQQAITPQDIIYSWSGVRSLLAGKSNSLSKTSREYKLELLLSSSESLPLLNVFGGKLTTYRALAELAVDKLKPYFPHMQPRWTSHEPLPGGEQNLRSLISQLFRQYPWIPAKLLQRYANTYGTDTHKLLDDVTCKADLGQCFGADLYEKEVTYLQEYEWARTAEDILFRRTKCGLFMNELEIVALEKYLS